MIFLSGTVCQRHAQLLDEMGDLRAENVRLRAELKKVVEKKQEKTAVKP